jgi:hypothetical protein
MNMRTRILLGVALLSVIGVGVLALVVTRREPENPKIITTCTNLAIYSGDIGVKTSKTYELEDQGQPGHDKCDRTAPTNGSPLVHYDCTVSYPDGWAEPRVQKLPPTRGSDSCRQPAT